MYDGMCRDASEYVSANLKQTGFCVVGKGRRYISDKPVERLVDNRASIGGRRIGFQRIEWPQTENIPRIDRVRITHPCFDPGYG